MSKTKILVISVVIVLLLMLLTGCNKQIFDTTYSYDKAICNIGGEYKELEIKQWKDYEGDQLQIKAKDGNTYLVSSFNCTLIDE